MDHSLPGSSVRGISQTRIWEWVAIFSRRDKKTLLSEQCKEIEENNRTGKTRDPFKKIGDTKETFHVRMGMIKGQKLKRVKKRWQEYTEELNRKGLNVLENYDGVPSLYGNRKGQKWKQWQVLFSWAPKSLGTVGDSSHEIQRHLLLGRKAMTNLDSIY